MTPARAWRYARLVVGERRSGGQHAENGDRSVTLVGDGDIAIFALTLAELFDSLARSRTRDDFCFFP